LPRITPEVVRRASAAFGQRTGVGGDHLHPRWFAHLSEVTLKRVRFLFSCFDSLVIVPSTLWNILLLYEKAQGGFRPIGLLPSIVRLWEYCRKIYLWDWESENQRDYNWAAPGKSSFTVVAHQRLAVESAVDTFFFKPSPF